MYTSFALAGLLLLGTTTQAATPAPTYTLNMELHDGARLVGSPRLEFLSGQTARIEIGDPEHGYYKLSMVAEPRTETTVSVTWDVDVVSPAGVHRRAKPVLVVGLGKASAFAFGEEAPGNGPIRGDFTVFAGH